MVIILALLRGCLFYDSLTVRTQFGDLRLGALEWSEWIGWMTGADLRVDGNLM